MGSKAGPFRRGEVSLPRPAREQVEAPGSALGQLRRRQQRRQVHSLARFWPGMPAGAVPGSEPRGRPTAVRVSRLASDYETTRSVHTAPPP